LGRCISAGRLISAIIWVLLPFVLTAAAQAKTRHALLVGVGNYREASGLSKLTAPANDAELMKVALEAGGVDFVADVLKEDDIKDKAAFETALRRFLSRVRPGDEVLFYFSGHGYHVPGRGNFFLLPDAKTQQVYLKDLGAPARRELDTQDKRDRQYRDWIAEIALSESAIEKAIEATQADVIVLIADACRNLIGPAKGASIVSSGLGLPRDASRGTYRIYSASPGQVSLDSPDRGPAARSVPERLARREAKDSSERESRRSAKTETSLFTRVLLQELLVPRLEINVLFSKVKIEVREQARKFGVEQIPDFYDSRDASLYYFRGGAAVGELEARCATARNELAHLRYGVAAGSVGRDQLESKKADLAPCGAEYVEEIDKLLRLESQGAGALSTTELGRYSDTVGLTDPIQICDILGSSPLDPNRPQGIIGFEIQKIALEALRSEEKKVSAIEAMRKTIAGCEAAAQARPRVARYKFNLARTYYALATLTDQKIEREDALLHSSRYNLEAVEQGYVAAYNNLALLHQNGEYFEQVAGKYERRPPDRKAAFQYFKRGADLNHVVAQYNLGMAYKNGELGLEVAAVDGSSKPEADQPTVNTRVNLAFQNLSRAAEAGFVPAMIETAKLVRWQTDTGLRQRAIELLEIASARGSWEAMYQLGWVYEFGGAVVERVASNTRTASVNYADAIVWYSRAAEAGDTAAQTRLANMLLEGQSTKSLRDSPRSGGRSR
jgi:TPR repeat protein